MKLARSNEQMKASNAVLSGVAVRVKGKRIKYLPPEQVQKPDRAPAARRPTRVARMLALAHHVQNAIDCGLVADRAAVARTLGLTRARVTQLLDLTLLAPKIQEAVLELEAVDGVEPMAEWTLRGVVRAGSWQGRRAVWASVRAVIAKVHHLEG